MASKKAEIKKGTEVWLLNHLYYKGGTKFNQPAGVSGTTVSDSTGRPDEEKVDVLFVNRRIPVKGVPVSFLTTVKPW